LESKKRSSARRAEGAATRRYNSTGNHARQITGFSFLLGEAAEDRFSPLGRAPWIAKDKGLEVSGQELIWGLSVQAAGGASRAQLDDMTALAMRFWQE
jgi:hypothetical protein